MLRVRRTSTVAKEKDFIARSERSDEEFAYARDCGNGVMITEKCLFRNN